MTKLSHIKNSYQLSKEAIAIPRGMWRPFTKYIKHPTLRAGQGIKNNWMKLPGTARYGTGLAVTLGMPTMAYMGGKSEAEDHIANTAYDDAYNMAQARIGQEWNKLPSWQRYTASTLGLENSIALKNSLSEATAPGGLTYESRDGVGNVKYT